VSIFESRSRHVVDILGKRVANCYLDRFGSDLTVYFKLVFLLDIFDGAIIGDIFHVFYVR
jgi:hypothetical protein